MEGRQVYVLGAGLMGSQVACEHALAGHRVVAAARDPERVRARVDAAFDVAVRHGLVDRARADAVRASVACRSVDEDVPAGTDLVVESVTESMEAKVALLGPVVRALPDATIASNTSSLSITALGEAVGAPERTLGTHYWNPPLLMPLVEVVPGERTDPVRVEDVRGLLEAAGKRPVLVRRDVPGFVWNRLQFALLREALSLVEDGVADAPTVDLVVRDGLARRWRHTGPFQTAALGGAETFTAVAANLFGHLSDATHAAGLAAVTADVLDGLDAAAERRDAGLAADAAADLVARTPEEPA